MAKFVSTEYDVLLERKKSTFICHLFPYRDFEAVKARLLKEHLKARHFVYAYRYINEYEQVVENSSDDGEPKGTSGKPSLAVLAGLNLVNTGIITIRYFGGVKLGTGGLVKAYSDAVNGVCAIAEFKDYEKREQTNVEVDHKDLALLLYRLKQQNIMVVNKVFSQRVNLTLEASAEKLAAFMKVYRL